MQKKVKKRVLKTTAGRGGAREVLPTVENAEQKVSHQKKAERFDLHRE
jgi:hypothetical protein